MSNKYMTKPSHPGYSSFIETKCDYCQTVFWESKSSYLKKKRHFCSMKCYSDFRREFLPKEEQHAFGKGFSIEERNLRAKCRSTLNHAIRDGKIIGPLPCEVCFTTHDIEAHHDDYNKPLEVRWLCFTHHRELHKSVYENPELLQ